MLGHADIHKYKNYGFEKILEASYSKRLIAKIVPMTNTIFYEIWTTKHGKNNPTFTEKTDNLKTAVKIYNSYDG